VQKGLQPRCCCVIYPDYIILEVPLKIKEDEPNNNVYTKAECDNKFQPKNSSHTITHVTYVENESEDLTGTFCETNGGIYFESAEAIAAGNTTHVGITDCICQVRQSTSLNSKIVGIITSNDQFASHGDVLVKVIDGVYTLGDILVPHSSGRARAATNEEKMFMALNAIPRPKIISLSTGLPNVVACFLT
jgi:hypothetical protein